MGYDLDALALVYPKLLPCVFINKYGTKTIDFGDPKSVKLLNTALLLKNYGIEFWKFPDSHLCPPIPGRVDYIHYLNDLLSSSGINNDIKALDIGTGATCIYPLLGNAVYNWDFLATDIDKTSLHSAQMILDKNKLNHHILLRHQKDASKILKGVLKEEDSFSVSMCNPPFFKSKEEAEAATLRKLKGLNRDEGKLIRNFSGTHNELWYQGGEKAFLHNYIYESSLFKKQCEWFTSLVSKKDLVKDIKRSLRKLGATDVKIINMGQGNKLSRIVAWTFKKI